jgi:hypothetical protein
LGWTLNSLAIWAIVFSPLAASKATFALSLPQVRQPCSTHGFHECSRMKVVAFLTEVALMASMRAAVPFLRAGCPAGGRRERGILLRILRSGGNRSLSSFSRCGEVSCPYWIFGRGFRGY